MQNIKYQLNKETKSLIDPKIIVPAGYHDYLDVFLKDASDALRPYGKYNHKIELLKDATPSNLGHSALQGMSAPQLEFVKKFFEEYLRKDSLNRATHFVLIQSYWLKNLAEALDSMLIIKS